MFVEVALACPVCQLEPYLNLAWNTKPLFCTLKLSLQCRGIGFIHSSKGWLCLSLTMTSSESQNDFVWVSKWFRLSLKLWLKSLWKPRQKSPLYDSWAKSTMISSLSKHRDCKILKAPTEVHGTCLTTNYNPRSCEPLKSHPGTSVNRNPGTLFRLRYRTGLSSPVHM